MSSSAAPAGRAGNATGMRSSGWRLVVVVGCLFVAGVAGAHGSVALRRQAIVFTTITELVVGRMSDDADSLVQLCVEDAHGRVEFSLPQLNAVGRPDLSDLQLERPMPKVVDLEGETPQFDFLLAYTIQVARADGSTHSHRAELAVLEKGAVRLPEAELSLCPIGQDGEVDRTRCVDSKIGIATRPRGHCVVPAIRFRHWKSYSD